MRLRVAPIALAALGATFAVAVVHAQKQTPQQAYPFHDPNLSIEQRVDDLVSRLTLDEKIGMLGQVQPAIPRLGIATFTNWTEGLHGLGWVRGGSVTAARSPGTAKPTRRWPERSLRNPSFC
jgi:beta-glucosidase